MQQGDVTFDSSTAVSEPEDEMSMAELLDQSYELQPVKKGTIISSSAAI